ncbi:serine/threonine-protein kinase [Nonomuraea jiangxiensis]|uniref:Serine/threonine protein kinase n=1 Tax=Nonomuraea jiangxiensis TaxID=633440 RepID=A0A1G9NIR6_9ACTN|nr:serine/threonine-protein kinase [Nonomuraea jiangxiensis]SDL86496.1 serine/threonine protein kinase [Nonomuraea jiangxiensis]
MVPGYREARQLGAGRTGRVFLATYQSTGAYVAIKYLNATLRRDTEFMDRFRSDAHALVEIDDPNVVRLYEYVETSTRAAVVTELVDGVSLRTLLTEHGRTSPEAALALLKSTLLALAAAHEAGVPHRDVKPENVLVQADGTSKLADFGIVVHAEEPGVPAGSPEYMAPELWTQDQAGPAADLYAAACVLFEAVRGRPPYRAYKEDDENELDVPAVRDKHLVEPVPLEIVPDTLRDLLKRGLAKDPTVRYGSARHFAAELEEDALAGYGPGWEQRGRRHLAEQATLLALRFPLARTETATGVTATLRDRMLKMPRLPPHLWVAGAAVVAVAIALVMSGGRLPPGPGTVLIPPPGAQEEPEPDEATTPGRGRTSATPRRTTATPAPTPGSGRGRGSTTRTPTPTGTPPPPPTSAPPPRPTDRPGGTSGSRPVVQTAGIARWSGTTGTVQVSVDGTGPVRLLITYTRRDGEDGSARTLRRETRTLRGSTTYRRTVTHDPGNVACDSRAYLGILVMTEPAAGNGPQVSEVSVDGPACPVQPTGSPTPPPTGSATPSPSGSGPPLATGSDPPLPSRDPVVHTPALSEPLEEPSPSSTGLAGLPEEPSPSSADLAGPPEEPSPSSASLAGLPEEPSPSSAGLVGLPSVR